MNNFEEDNEGCWPNFVNDIEKINEDTSEEEVESAHFGSSNPISNEDFERHDSDFV